MSDRGKVMGKVKSKYGEEYDYYWNESTGAVYVETNYAGQASSAAEAFKKANHLAQMSERWKD